MDKVNGLIINVDGMVKTLELACIIFKFTIYINVYLNFM